MKRGLTIAARVCFMALFFSIFAQDKPLPVLQYVDGNGNSYEFAEDGGDYVLEFIPVKKKNSSSGNYSGGEPATRRVSEEKFNTVIARMDKALAKKKFAANREKGTALIIKQVKSDFREYILPRSSGDIKEIEALLLTLF